MTFAREGMSFIATAFLLAAAAFAMAILKRSWPLWVVAILLTVIALWVAYFFRDPEREGDRAANLVVAPADGLVVMITPVDEPTFIGGKANRISIFMNIFNVHVNRYPITGTVTYVSHAPGRFLNAMADQASLENEQTSVGLELPGTGGRILVRQIAGLIARRIITYSHDGDHARQGERMGLIRFGSRVDVFVPLDAKLEVSPGVHTVAGVTRLAELPAR